jgi:hypothetical protein
MSVVVSRKDQHVQIRFCCELMCAVSSCIFLSAASTVISKLRAMYMEDDSHCIRVILPLAKNDQYHNGRTTCLVSNDSIVDPVVI